MFKRLPFDCSQNSVRQRFEFLFAPYVVFKWRISVIRVPIGLLHIRESPLRIHVGWINSTKNMCAGSRRGHWQHGARTLVYNNEILSLAWRRLRWQWYRKFDRKKNRSLRVFYVDYDQTRNYGFPIPEIYKLLAKKSDSVLMYYYNLRATN